MFHGHYPTYGNPTGIARRLSLFPFRDLMNRYTIYLISRRPGVLPGTTIADFAADYANAISATLDVPVNLVGLSAGGAIALQFAADHPHLVHRLVVAGAAHTWSPQGKAALLDWLARVRAGRHPMQAMTGLVMTSPLLRPWARALMWVQDMDNRGKDMSDGIVTAEALVSFSCLDQLAEVVAPLLLIAGERDPFLSESIIRQTVAGAPFARLVVYPRRGHFGVFMDKRFSQDVAAFLARP
jgi:pimeloyl-ACP methyl ester carboxylesterase